MEGGSLLEVKAHTEYPVIRPSDAMPCLGWNIPAPPAAAEAIGANPDNQKERSRPRLE